MQIQAIFITTSLTIQKKLAEFAGPKTCPNHPII